MAPSSEPGEGAHTDHTEAALLLRRSILRELTRLQNTRTKKLLERRYERYRETGSTRSHVRGTLERRLAHLFDRVGGARDRLLRRSSSFRRRADYGEHPDIPV